MAAVGIGNPLFSSSLPPSIKANPPFLTPNRRITTPPLWISKKLKLGSCYSSQSDQQAEEKLPDSPNETILSMDDADYLWKLAAGSVGGGAFVKYGSVLFPEITRPNILQALLMISLPVLVAVVILVKESRTESES